MPRSIVTVAVDAMGGDDAPGVVIEGVAQALSLDPELHVLLVGPEAVVTPHASERCTPVVATEVIDMGEHPATAVRSKKDSSIVVGCRLVREDRAEGFFSAGSTGACMAAATLVMGRIPGVQRPAIAAVIPASARPTVLLDVGANADVKPEMLVQFAIMGRAYAQAVFGVDEPTVGLLNIGEEPTKGSQLAQDAHALLAAYVPGFAGNVEGRDVPAGTTDVVVTDGFTGNVTLKTLEGLSAMLFSEIKTSLTTHLHTKLAAAVLKPALRALKGKLDPDTYGGAPLLGVAGVCIIGHGSSGARAVTNGVMVAARAARNDLTERITEGIAERR
ncbi:MAG: phosphate acyltransferase PlsX [Coriobacteriia bacterium]|nr:phosphate acyltransferase PlsX [Coriobacteriia bacterium]MBN2847134.1 phosphate acyltransferase PlsX [Coriobacteriia bacterium]